MERGLVVIGCQQSKLELAGKKYEKKLMEFIASNRRVYRNIIGVVRDSNFNASAAKNFLKERDQIGNVGMNLLPFEVDEYIAVPGYDIDVSKFRRDAQIQYDIVGISTGASVITAAMSMYSNGMNVRVLSDLCTDRKGIKCHEAAILLMSNYMPGCVI